MCGIAGIYHYNDPSQLWKKLVHDFVGGLIHRGPDEEGFFFSNHISMGVRRLKVIDLEFGSQPISNEDGNIHIVCNGEIYRFESLRKDLIEKGHRFRTKTDIEIIVHLYEEHGLDFLSYLDGMFTFALWDECKERLIVARDRFGIKPLFYTTEIQSGFVAFCSELTPLRGIPGLSLELDAVAVNQYFTLSYILHPRTIYRGVKKCSPGSYLLVEKDYIREVQYWQLPCPCKAKGAEHPLRALDESISSAVKAMMRCDVPYGAFLSGGLDSGSIVYYMQQHASEPVKTFSVRFDEKTFDEGEEARQIAIHLKTDHHELRLRPEDVLTLPDLFSHFGEPFADPALIPTFYLSQFASDSVTVALSGDGGDEIFGGYLTYIASLATKLTRLLPEALIDIIRSGVNYLPASMENVSIDHKLKKYLSGCQLPPLEHHAAWKTIFTTTQQQELFTQDFLQQISQVMGRPVFYQWGAIFQDSQRDPLSQYQRLDIKTFLIDNNLTRVDRMSMANSLEVRIPFLDQSVVSAAFQIPARDRIRRLRTKLPLRQLMKGRLPDRIVNMGKRGFRVPLSLWFQGSLKDFVYDTLSRAKVESTGILRYKTVEQILSNHMSGKMNLNRQIWSLICYQLWHDQNQ